MVPTMILLLSMTCMIAAYTAADGSTTGSSPPRPNILLFLTDDQDLELGSMGAMPFARERLVKGGTRLSNFFAHTPVCCPSRSELLSGRYFQNIRVATAADKGCMRVNITDTFHNTTLAVPLQAAGYTTGLFGKYLNGGGPKYLCPAANKTSGGEGKPAPFRPRGWDKFFGMCPDDCYEDCLFVEDGVGRRFNEQGFVNGSNYATSVIGNATVQWLSAALRRQQERNLAPAPPIFAYIAPHAPHTAPAGQSMVAPWYKHAFARAGIRAPRTPAYGVAAPDHHWLVATQPELTLPVKLELDMLALMRWQALLSVEDMLREIFAVVEEHDAMQRTFFLFTSDHGASAHARATLCPG
jgi:N-acetylglucosamine-6-sulfatase